MVIPTGWALVDALDLSITIRLLSINRSATRILLHSLLRGQCLDLLPHYISRRPSIHPLTLCSQLNPRAYASWFLVNVHPLLHLQHEDIPITTTLFIAVDLVVATFIITDSSANMSSTIGSMADVPKDLIQEIQKLEQLFTVDTARLKHITDHFVSELEKGRQLRSCQ
jgi:hypothetical protein